MPDLSTITPVTREEEFLDRIARAAASPNLPEVDASDNGDVLTVVSGEWAAAAPAGGLPEVTSSNNGQVLTVVSGEWAAANPATGVVVARTITAADLPDTTGKTIDSGYYDLSDPTAPIPILFIYNNNVMPASGAVVKNGTPAGNIFPLFYEGSTSDGIYDCAVGTFPMPVGIAPVEDSGQEGTYVLTVNNLTDIYTSFVDVSSIFTSDPIDTYHIGVLVDPSSLVWVRLTK